MHCAPAGPDSQGGRNCRWSGRLITGWSLVRIRVGPPGLHRIENFQFGVRSGSRAQNLIPMPRAFPPPSCSWLRPSSDTYRRPRPSALSLSQSLSLVVPVGGASDVSRSAKRPSISSRASARSRINRTASPVRVKPTSGGVCNKHMRTPVEETSRRSRASKEKVFSPAASTTDVSLCEPTTTPWTPMSLTYKCGGGPVRKRVPLCFGVPDNR